MPQDEGSFGEGSLGFRGMSKPSPRHSVSLKATINGITLGDAWSNQTTYSEGTEHAEDAVIDLVGHIEGAVQYQLGRLINVGEDGLIEGLEKFEPPSRENTRWNLYHKRIRASDPRVQAQALHELSHSFHGAMIAGLDPNVLYSVQKNMELKLPNTLVIDKLTASPCSTVYGTRDRKDGSGCAEKLIELAQNFHARWTFSPEPGRSKRGRMIRPASPDDLPEIKWQITIIAEHYYQPKLVGGERVRDSKERSKRAVAEMQRAGIIVKIRKP
jgi:hypothetical protein